MDRWTNPVSQYTKANAVELSKLIYFKGSGNWISHVDLGTVYQHYFYALKSIYK